MNKSFCIGGASLLATMFIVGCKQTPTAPTAWSLDRTREQLLISNLNSASLGASGRVTRWRVPIEVNTSGMARAELALTHYERWTNNLIRFTRTTGVPANGLVFVEGGAVAPEEGGSCGNITDVPPPASSNAITFRWDTSRALTGTYYIRLGSDRCNDAREGRYESSVAEHQLAHALGVIEHFDGFNGNIGLDDSRLVAVLVNLYSNPIGTTAADLTIWGNR